MLDQYRVPASLDTSNLCNECFHRPLPPLLHTDGQRGQIVIRASDTLPPLGVLVYTLIPSRLLRGEGLVGAVRSD